MIRHALILTAGLGTRLRPLTDVRAKPAIPVGGVPMIRRIVAWLVSRGVDDCVLNLHHLPHTLTAALGDGRDLGARVRYSWEQPRILGSAGGPRLARAIVGTGTFWIVNGDTLTDVDLAALERAHHDADARVTLALVPNTEYERYGGVQLDADRRVTGFVRKGAGAKGTYHYIGIQLVDGGVFDVVPLGDAANTIGGIYDALIARAPGAVRGVVVNAPFHDVGTVADYLHTCAALGRADAAPPARADIHPTARVTGSILWDDVRVDEGAVVADCILTDRVVIPAGATLSHAVVIAAPDGSLQTIPLTTR